ncbi:MAG TPA: hypothetical protein VKA70_16620 [Blastocatellia bacterium]|nr:hypothetical protein [Blastocatellia bacterium]
MLRRSILASFIILIASVALAQAVAQGPKPAMKGYELYSWKRDGDWRFSIVEGTNRRKTYEEITSDKTALNGNSGLKAQLDKLPKGSEVIWMSGVDPAVLKTAAGRNPKLELPSGKRVRKIKKYCDKIGIKLTLG